ncbi:YD repeat-containing protein [Thiogranum longum]|uniref:YD repeat-containing protein n=1 Tax=Thiogranum longum TaxID=1537524 RepID=A0A4R1HFI8_9GAMM|nr:class I SAM-dependent methyltransferase [Thiogranum longum]TCK18099.1 YD repeat-containing protein [Thiogranum longum]
MIKRVGKLPASNRFAGNIQPGKLDTGALYHCSKCSLKFRYPRPEKEELERLYRSGSDTNWSDAKENRKDWKVVSEIIQKNCRKGKVLDVGCFDGGFLLSLDGEYELFGIEVNDGAVARARSRGIRIVRQDYDGLGEVVEKFDVIVAIDVIEHVIDPKTFLSNLLSMLAPDGLVVLSTGNADSASWKFMGSRYWYCANPEHISFISPAWCEKTCSKMGAVVGEYACFSYRSKGLTYRILDLLKNTTYKYSPWIFAASRILGLGKRGVYGDVSLAYYPPTWLSAKDHFAVEILKDKSRLKSKRDAV